MPILEWFHIVGVIGIALFFGILIIGLFLSWLISEIRKKDGKPKSKIINYLNTVVLALIPLVCCSMYMQSPAT